MKKIVLIFALLFSTSALADAYIETVSDCDDAQMRVALDNAAAEHRAVITVVECEETETEKTVTMAPRYTRNWNNSYMNTYRPCDAKPMSAVVNREYFVRETVQEYKPVVKYVPAGRYVRVRPACNECNQ